MKFFLFITLFISSLFVHAQTDTNAVLPSLRNTTFDKTPVFNYQKAKQKHQLEKLTVEQRLGIMNSIWKDSLELMGYSNAQKAVMMEDIITSTAPLEIPKLFRLFGTDLKGFQDRFYFLPFDQMTFIVTFLKPSFHKRIIDSRIFKISYEKFEKQLDDNIQKQGDNLFQSHYTDFCGKVAVVRLWIKYNPDDYKRFMTDLYYTGKAELNGIEFKTPKSVIDAVNDDLITEDPNQKILFKNPEVNEKMPELMDMVLYLTLASSFHTFPFNNVEYQPGKHLENSAWAGASIKTEYRFLKAMGFRPKKVGDNFRGISRKKFREIEAAGSKNSQKKVMLLVNSSMLDTLTGACNEYDCPRPVEHKYLGTHWITVNYIDVANDSICIWEYGKYRKMKGLEEMKKIIAGGIIIDGFQPGEEAKAVKISPTLRSIPSPAGPSH
jgi:hypothetical protein